MRHVLAALSVLYGCSTEFAFETPQTWEDRYTELAAEYGLPDSYPNPGQRPDKFSCAVWSPVGCLLVEGDDPEWTTFYVQSFDGVWSEPSTLRTPPGGVLSVDLADGTVVFLVGNLLIFDGGYTKLDSCVRPNVRPSESARCVD